jgi:hypothetical protein
MTKLVSVEEFMNAIEYRFKEEVQFLRNIIKETDENILEQIKWNAPSFSYIDPKSYLMTFNLRSSDKVHIVVHHPKVALVQSKILEGDYADRRMIYFTDMNDILAKKLELESVVNELIKLSK